MKPETQRISSALFKTIHSEILNNPKTMAFTFVINPEKQTAEIITTNKFTQLLNQELIKQLAHIATARIEEPKTVNEAIDRFKVYEIPLPRPIEVSQQQMPMGMEIESKPHNQRAFTPSRRMTPISRNSQRMSPATPMTHNYAQLEPDMIIPKPPQSCVSPTKRKRTITPHKPCFHQTIDSAIDDSTKQKLMSVLGKPNGDEN